MVRGSEISSSRYTAVTSCARLTELVPSLRHSGAGRRPAHGEAPIAFDAPIPGAVARPAARGFAPGRAGQVVVVVELVVVGGDVGGVVLSLIHISEPTRLG